MSVNHSVLFTNPKIDPLIRIIDDLNNHIDQVTFGADFWEGIVIAEDGLPAIRTHLEEEDLPAVSIYEEDSKMERTGIGDVFDSEGEFKVFRFKSILTIDIWGIDAYQRELANSLITKYLISQDFDFRSLGFILFQEGSSRSRGFDLTDRILQFHSHQITNIVRRLLYYDVEYEVVQERTSTLQRVTKMIINSIINGEAMETISLGDFGVPLPLFENMKKRWC